MEKTDVITKHNYSIDDLCQIMIQQGYRQITPLCSTDASQHYTSWTKFLSYSLKSLTDAQYNDGRKLMEYIMSKAKVIRISPSGDKSITRYKNTTIMINSSTVDIYFDTPPLVADDIIMTDDLGFIDELTNKIIKFSPDKIIIHEKNSDQYNRFNYLLNLLWVKKDPYKLLN